MKRLLSWLFRFDPPERGAVELFLGRLFLAIVIYSPPFWAEHFGSGFFFDVAHEVQRVPNGLAQFFDFTFIGDHESFIYWKWSVGVALLLYVAGVAPLLSIGYTLFVMVSVGTLRNSQGNIHHGTQMISMFVFGLFIAHAIAACRGRISEAFVWAGRSAHNTAVHYGMQMAAATYVVAGVWKCHRSGFFGWIWDLPNLSLQVLKIGFQHFYGTGDSQWLEHARRVADILLAHPNLTRLAIGSGLLVELLAFAAVFNRRLSIGFGIGLFIMHLMITYVMQLKFGLNEWILIIFFINVPFFLALPFDWWNRKKGAPESAHPSE